MVRDAEHAEPLAVVPEMLARKSGGEANMNASAVRQQALGRLDEFGMLYAATQ